MREVVPIKGDDLWIKIVEMLQHNWACIEADSDSAQVFFITDASHVFDQMSFGSEVEAIEGLLRNGFRRFASSPEVQSFVVAPRPPYLAGPS